MRSLERDSSPIEKGALNYFLKKGGRWGKAMLDVRRRRRWENLLRCGPSSSFAGNDGAVTRNGRSQANEKRIGSSPRTERKE